MTLAALGKQIGDTVRIGRPPFTRTVKITGTVTLPSFGIGAAEHVSLGRGVMVPEAGSLGVAPVVEVPLTVVVLGLAALVLVGNLLAGLPAAVAARTRPAAELRTE